MAEFPGEVTSLLGVFRLGGCHRQPAWSIATWYPKDLPPGIVHWLDGHCQSAGPAGA